jgi:phosphoglycerol transferase MdoB-like AlkP superfamily enzyme
VAIRSGTRSFTPTRHRFSLAEQPNLYFWLLFLSLNMFLFLPSYLLSSNSNSFLPVLNGTGDPSRWARQLLLWRNNLDIFRLSAEFTILLALWVLLPWARFPRLRRPFRWLFAFTYIIALLYAIYESVTIYTYQTEAVFYAHARMVVDGLGFLLQHLHVQAWLIAAGVVAVGAGTACLLAFLRAIAGGIPVGSLSRWTRLMLALLAVLSLSAMIHYRGNLASRKSVISSIAFKLQKNTAESIALHQRVQSLNTLSYSQIYDYTGHDLLAKPDIYLIFVESYGSILYKKAAFRDVYTKTITELTGELEKDGWYATSALSESPTWGGGSWMAYTSTLFGLRVDNHPQYVALLERFQNEAYPDLGNYLQSQGYQYIRATSLAVELPDEEWQKYVNFFGVDRWIRYSDLDYQGMHYGWGPSPPDQFVLNTLNEDINNSTDQPFLLFWITQNSHYPWRMVPQVVENWQSMNDGNDGVTLYEDDAASQSAKQENYLAAIKYELAFLTDFILREADDDAVFILIGDHQPGYVTRRSDGFDTPLHIISKDKAFLDSFAEYGFEPGLLVDNPAAAIRHEGFYSLFMRTLLGQYGHEAANIPPYQPNGIQLPLD